MDAEKLVKHMAWANQEIISQVMNMPNEALDAYVVNPEWTVREIARHIASSATWYGWRLLDKSAWSESDHVSWKSKLDATEIPPATSKDIAALLNKLSDADEVLLEAARKPEGEVLREVDGKMIIRARSTIISQAIHHATEHRAQLVSALEARGFTSINLDDCDLWAYCDKHGEGF
ncbi:MAG: hypothetical protein RL414_185 [Actinomycetota bacterium]